MSLGNTHTMSICIVEWCLEAAGPTFYFETKTNSTKFLFIMPASASRVLRIFSLTKMGIMTSKLPNPYHHESCEEC